MHDVVAAAEVGILVRERVEAVRARCDDLAHAGLVQRPHVLLGEGLEDVLVAHPPGGIAGARLARAEDGEVDPGRLHQLRGRLGRRPGALVERRRAADPVEHLGRRIARLEHAHAEPLRPRGPVGLGLAPRVGRALDVAQHRLGLGREPGLDHHQMPAQVDDVVDVLDRHRALLHARAAGDAVPHHVVADRAGDERRRLGLPAGGTGGGSGRPLGEEVVAQAHDQELGREVLAGRPRRAGILAAAALRARVRIDDLLPGHVRRRCPSPCRMSSSGPSSSNRSGSSRPRARVRPK